MNSCFGRFALLATLILHPATGIAQTATSHTTTPHASAASQSASIVGTWMLTAADVIKADGTRTADYGPQPRGLAMFSANGHFMVAVYRAERLKFASNDKLRGTAEEWRVPPRPDGSVPVSIFTRVP